MRVLLLPSASLIATESGDVLAAYGASAGYGSVLAGSGGIAGVSPCYATNLHLTPACTSPPIDFQLIQYLPTSGHFAAFRPCSWEPECGNGKWTAFGMGCMHDPHYFIAWNDPDKNEELLVAGESLPPEVVPFKGRPVSISPPLAAGPSGALPALRAEEPCCRPVLSASGGLGSALSAMASAGVGDLRMFLKPEAEGGEPWAFIPLPGSTWAKALESLAEEALNAYPLISLEEGSAVLVLPVFFKFGGRWHAVAGVASFSELEGCAVPQSVRLGIFRLRDLPDRFELVSDILDLSPSLPNVQNLGSIMQCQFCGAGIPAVSVSPSGDVVFLWYFPKSFQDLGVVDPILHAVYASLRDGAVSDPFPVPTPAEGGIFTDLWAYAGVVSAGGKRWLAVLTVSEAYAKYAGIFLRELDALPMRPVPKLSLDLAEELLEEEESGQRELAGIGEEEDAGADLEV